ncbi:hypothetical protein [Candidatus Nitrospira bockiana]
MLVTRFRTVLILFILIHAIAIGSDSSEAAPAAPGSAGSPVVFVAHDYGFTGPDRIPAGMTTMQVVNQGQDVHHIQVVKLLEGKTAADLATALKSDQGRFPSWVKMVGGPNAVGPGSQALATMNLVPGEYVLLCLIPDKQGVPHLALGMQKGITVTGAKPSLVSEPAAASGIALEDFRFKLSGPIAAGAHTIRVTNQGTQPHEVVVVQLAPGVSVSEFVSAVEKGTSGPPPGKLIGGLVGLETGDHAFFKADFEPGRYGLICFFPDAGTGQPHFARGMTTEFTVK